MQRIFTNNFPAFVLGSLFLSVLFSMSLMLPRTAEAAANIGIVSVQKATSSANHVLVQLDNPNSSTISSIDNTKWNIDSPATTSRATSIILESGYPFTVRLIFDGPLSASYVAADGLSVQAGAVTDSTGNTNAVVADANSIAIPVADATGPTLTPVTIASNNASTTLAKSGDVVTLSFTSNKGIFTPGATTTIGTHTAGNVTKTRTSPTEWTATATMDGTDTVDSVVAFILSGLKSIQGIPASANVTAITSGSDVIYDRTSPTITLVGSGSDSVFVSGTQGYADQGATVSDSREGAINSTLITTGSVNRTIPGTYTFTYNASDSAGNAATAVTRTVTVNHLSAGGIFTGNTSSLPGFKAPRAQVVYPDGRIVYLDENQPGSSQPNNVAIPTPPVTTGSGNSTSYMHNFTRMLTNGSSGDDVVTLQTFLEDKGFLVIPQGVPKGYFGPLTEGAVMKYQESVGIETVGIVGPKTRAALNKE